MRGPNRKSKIASIGVCLALTSLPLMAPAATGSAPTTKSTRATNPYSLTIKRSLWATVFRHSNLVTKNATFTPSGDYSVTSGQDWGGVKSRKIKKKGGSVITVNAGASNSADVAAWFVDRSTATWMSQQPPNAACATAKAVKATLKCMNLGLPKPDSLAFAVTGTLTIGVKNPSTGEVNFATMSAVIGMKLAGNGSPIWYLTGPAWDNNGTSQDSIQFFMGGPSVISYLGGG